MTVHHLDRILDHPTHPGTNWAQHEDALKNPRRGFESAYTAMLFGWLKYADTHTRRYDDGIGNDGVLGPEWESIGKALKALLNGDIGGRLDAGTISTLITRTLSLEGFGMGD